MTDAENMNELDEPVSQKRNKRPWLILSLLIVILAITALSLISDSWRDNRSIDYIRVYGNSMVNSSDLNDTLESIITGKYIKDIDIAGITEIIMQNSFVDEVRINPLFNGEFQIFITERKPIAITINQDGELQFVDASGFVFPYSEKFPDNDFPVIRGISGNDRFIQVASLLNRIINESSEYLGIISEIMPGRGHNTFDIISSDYAYRLIIDSRTNLNEQLKKYYTFLGSSICGNEKIKIDYLDLRWEKRLVIGKLT
ncbi:MAG: hypothetical protein KIT33_11630 [Candidatus Kapabacteria bacterium]|nr:hypothetical protein [Ignavibacteriota bacterium]MCW5885610.1 hypothetical protein [Candidatus Kapabacteria bacterium]